MKKNMKCTENIFRNRSIIRKNILIHAGLNTIFQFNINILINLLKFHLITWYLSFPHTVTNHWSETDSKSLVLWGLNSSDHVSIYYQFLIVTKQIVARGYQGSISHLCKIITGLAILATLVNRPSSELPSSISGVSLRFSWRFLGSNLPTRPFTPFLSLWQALSTLN